MKTKYLNRAGFIKMNELQDFLTKFLFIAPENRKFKKDSVVEYLHYVEVK